MLRLLLDVAIAVAVPGGVFYGGYRIVKWVRNRQRMKRVEALTYAAIMDAAALNYTDAEWKRLARKIFDEPETVYDDVPEIGWKAKAITQRKWGQS